MNKAQGLSPVQRKIFNTFMDACIDENLDDNQIQDIIFLILQYNYKQSYLLARPNKTESTIVRYNNRFNALEILGIMQVATNNIIFQNVEPHIVKTYVNKDNKGDNNDV